MQSYLILNLLLFVSFCVGNMHPFLYNSTSLEPWFVHPIDAPDCKGGIDDGYNRKRSAYLVTLPQSPPVISWCSLMQNFKADNYRGKRLLFSAVVRAEVVFPFTMIWIRAEGPNKENLTGVNGPQVKGTMEWKRQSLVFYVPENSMYISFGVGPLWRGEVWISDIQFEETDAEPVGNDGKPYPDKPGNLDFSGK
jgi:hypothetical protein